MLPKNVPNGLSAFGKGRKTKWNHMDAVQWMFFIEKLNTSESQHLKRNHLEKSVQKTRIRAKIEFDIFTSEPERRSKQLRCSAAMLYNRIMRWQRIFLLLIRNFSCGHGPTEFLFFFFVFSSHTNWCVAKNIATSSSYTYYYFIPK